MIRLLANLDVEDLERGIEFYRGALDLRLRRLLFGGTVAELVGASSAIFLLAKPSGSAASSDAPLPRDYHRHWTPVHLDFVVGDVDAAVRRACAAGATLEGGVATHPWGRMATLADPFGHGFCLLEFSGPGYDQGAL